MAQSSANSMLANLTQANRPGVLTEQVRDLPKPAFIELLKRITTEFEHFIKAIELINNESLEKLLEELLEAFTLKIGQILSADRTTIFMVDEDKQELWSKIAEFKGGESLEIRVPINKGIAGYVASKGLCLNIPNAYEDDRFDPSTDEKTGYRTHNILCMPVFSEGARVVAVVQLLNKIGGPRFTEEDEREFETFARSIGILLESCNSFYTAARTQKGLTALLNAISSLEQSLDLDVTLQSVMAEARNLMQADRSTLWLVDRDRKNELWTRVRSADGTEMVPLRQSMKKGIVGHVASTQETLNISNAYDDPRFDPSADEKTGYVTRTILCMPVFDSSGKNLIGVTQLINKAQGYFTSYDVSFMRAFNIQAGIAIENAQLYDDVLQEKRYQKDILQSLSDAVISTDKDGYITTINDAALMLLGCPIPRDKDTADREFRNITDQAFKQSRNDKFRQIKEEWERSLLGRKLWEVFPIDSLEGFLANSLTNGAQQYFPERTLRVAVGKADGQDSLVIVLGTDSDEKALFWAVGQHMDQPVSPTADVQFVEHNIDLHVNPLLKPEGDVRGGLVVMEDISQEKRMKTTLYRYMTPSVAEQVMALGEDSLMVGERRDVTVLFSDIRGYTSLTESLEAAEVVSMLNEYFETMVEAVFNHDGTLDKFIGDALMAVFGAPLPLSNHALSAVQSALEMRERLVNFNRSRRAKTQPEIRIGIGLSSGEVVSGNIGSQRKMEYTVIGDGVNLSSRLEGVTKEYDCDIVLSEHTYALCKQDLLVRELDIIRVKGKQEPVKIYDLIGYRASGLGEQDELFLNLYQQGRDLYTAMDFAQAIERFTQAQVLRPQDRAVEIHLERARRYLQSPPPRDWDGVHIMTTK